jgi:hypothetical protein
MDMDIKSTVSITMSRTEAKEIIEWIAEADSDVHEAVVGDPISDLWVHLEEFLI